MTGLERHGLVSVGVSARPDHLSVVDWAAAEATRRGSALRVVHVQPTRGDAAGPPELPAVGAGSYGVMDEAHATLAAAVQRVRFAHPELSLSGRMLSGDVANALAGETSSTDLLAIGDRDESWLRHVLAGSFAGSVVKHATCPVAVVPSGLRAVDPEGPVVVGVATGVLVLRPLAFAFDCASRTGRPLHVVHCWQPPPPPASRDHAEAELRLRLNTLLDDYVAQFPDVVVSTLLIPSGTTADELAWQSQHASVVIVGARQRKADSHHALGPVSKRLLDAAACPVVVVPTQPDSGDRPLMRSIGHGLWFAPDPRTSKRLG